MIEPGQSGVARPAGTALVAYRGEHARSRALHARALRVMPGGNTRHSLTADPYPVYVASGRGCRVVDVEGAERIDFLNNFTALILGHADPVTLAAVHARLDLGTAFASPTESDVELAELLVGRVPALERVRFCNSGSEAVMLAVKAARAYTGRAGLAKCEGAYHGLYDYAQVSERSAPDAWGPDDCPASLVEAGVSPRVADEVVVLPWNDADACERLIERHKNRLAAVIVDPLPLGISLVSPVPGFLARLREVTTRHGILLIADEVMSFRLGYHGASAREGIRPDLMCLAKIIGGGFPVGAVGGRVDVMDVFDHAKGMAVHHGGTYNGNPVTMTAGLATMTQLTPETFTRLDDLGALLRRRLADMLASRGTLAQILGEGSLFSVRLTATPLRGYRDVQRHIRQCPIYRDVCHAMLARGILLSQRGIQGCLSTPMTEVEVEAFVQALDGALASVESR
ncbi:MAG: aspartate aminotransferase family protein [Vicinamibacterales bacterium]